MFRNSEATQSSEQWVSSRSILGSTESHASATTNRSHSSSIDKDDTNSTSYATGNESEIRETTNPTIISSPTPSIPPPLLSTLAGPAPLIMDSPVDPTYETQVSADELSESKPQSAYQPSDTSGLSPLQMPVRHPSQSQPNIQAQSTILHSPVSHTTNPVNSVVSQESRQFPSQHSRESYHVPTTEIPQTYVSRTYDDIPVSPPGAPQLPYQSWNSNLPQGFVPQRFIPFQQSAPNTPFIYPGTPSQSYKPQSAVRPQSYSSGPTRPFVPQSGRTFTSISHVPDFTHVPSPQPFSSGPHIPPRHARSPQVQSIHDGTPQQFVPQSVPSQSFGPTNHPTLPPRGTYNSHAPDLDHVPSPQRLYVSSRPIHSPQVQSTHEGTPPPFVPQSAPPQSFGPTSPPVSITGGMLNSYAPGPGHVPSMPSSLSGYNSIPQSVKPQRSRRKVDNFVASNPFRMSYGDDKVDAPSDPLSFDDIPTVVSDSEPKFSQGMVNSPYGSILSKLTSAGNIPPYGAYGQGHSLTQPEIHPPSNIPVPQIPLRQPTPFIPPDWEQFQSDHASEQEDDLAQPHLPSAQSEPSTPVSLPPVQSQAPVFPDSPLPSAQHSPIIEPKSDDTVTAVPVHQSSSSDSSSIKSERRTDGTPFRPHILSYRHHQHHQHHPDYLQHSQSPELPKKPFFSQFARFFQWSHPTHPSPIDPDINSYEHKFTKAALKFMLVTLPTQMYLHFLLLRLPSLYLYRVARIFEEADMSLPEIKKMALETASQGLKCEFEIQMAFESSSDAPAYKSLKLTWEFFIDSVMREWKTFNIISVLLLAAILTVLQIQSAAEDPLTRYTALLSLMCALMSLLFGCIYIVRFGSMRKTYKAAEWALEAKSTKTLVWWNVWILLAIPAIWLTWSIILYIVCIMSFVWRSTVTGTTSPGISDTGLLTIRIVITVVLAIGVLFGFLIMTTFRRYGEVMDKAWKQRIDRWIEEKSLAKGYPSPYYAYPMHQQSPYHQPSSGDAHGRYASDTYSPAHASDAYRDNPQYSSSYTYPDRSTMYQRPTYKSSPYYQPPFGDDHGGYAWGTYGPAHAPDAYPDNLQYSSAPYTYPDGSTMYQQPTYKSSPYYQPSFGDARDGYALDMYDPPYASDTYVPPPGPYSTPIGWPHSPLSTDTVDTVTHANTILNQASNRQRNDNMTSAVYTPSPGTTPPPLPPKVPITAVEGTHIRLVPKTKPILAVPPYLPPIPGTPITPFVDQSSKDKGNTLPMRIGSIFGRH